MKINNKWKWAAKDENGEVFLFTLKPSIFHVGKWGFNSPSYDENGIFNAVDVTYTLDTTDFIGLDWKDSLHQVVNGELVKFPDLQVDDKIYVRNDVIESWRPRHFSHFSSLTGAICAFDSGKTSFTTNKDYWCEWVFWRKA